MMMMDGSDRGAAKTQGCSLGLGRLGLETFFEHLGIVSVSASCIAFT